MREIKFRGKTINGDWVFGNYAHIKKDFSTVNKGHYISNSAGSPFAYMVRPETLGQFIGLEDCCGNKIFEGDIIKGVGVTSYDKPIINRVAYHDTSARFGLANLNGDIISDFFQWVSYPLEIIGNIHDNPELLKKTNPMNTLFDLNDNDQVNKQNTCRYCEHRQRWECGGSVIQYCGIRKSNRTYNGLLKIKVTTAACQLFKNQKHNENENN